jgi:hypothetical protein
LETHYQTRTIRSEVPQGSMLGPTLFQIFINDLLQLPLSLKVHAYADDTLFFMADKDLQTTQARAQADLDKISHWCHTNKMIINAKKSHYLLSASSSDLELKIANSCLPRKQSIKVLGFLINDNLNWKDHIRELSQKITTNLRLFYLTQHLMTTQIAKIFYYNFIHSYLTYGIHIYFNLSPDKLTNELFLLQKKALRLILKVKLSDRWSTRDLCFKLDILPLPALSNYFTALFAHLALTRRAPDYILSLFPTRSHTYSHRNLSTLPSSSAYNQLNHKTMSIFNSLPLKIHSINSSHTFKLHVKLHLLQNL